MTFSFSSFVPLRVNARLRAVFSTFVALLGLFAGPTLVSAATLYLSPSSGSYPVGGTFTVNVMVSSASEAANGYSGTVSYPSDLLELTSLGKGGSVVSLWVQEPSYSSGMANFEGVTFNPGYKGGAGKIISLTFKAKARGTATVRFNSGSILANDGQGTNILTGLGSAKFTIGEGAEPEPTPTPTPDVTGKPATPKITSPTHPDPAAWYAVNDATFKWGLQSGVDGVNILADQQPTSDPGTSSDGLFSSYTYQDVKDGTWYAHLRVRNKNGWSSIAHFQFNIDTVGPDAFTIHEIPVLEPSDLTRSFRFDASDSGSGIAQYEVRIDDEAPQMWKDDGTHVYVTPPASPGKHTLRVRALDKAGNAREATVEFRIQALAAPRITDTPRDARSGDVLVVKGMTYPNTNVMVWTQFGDEQARGQAVTSDDLGKFVFVSEEDLREGSYRVWATVSDALGNVSEPSDIITIRVKPPAFRFGEWVSGLFARVTISFILILLLLILFVILLWRYIKLAQRMGQGKAGAKEALHEAFDLLKDDLEEQVKLLEHARSKRELTIEEGRILKKLKKDLSVAEAYVRKKIKNIGHDR
jgi:hypothetical protein